MLNWLTWDANELELHDTNVKFPVLWTSPCLSLYPKQSVRPFRLDKAKGNPEINPRRLHEQERTWLASEKWISCRLSSATDNVLRTREDGCKCRYHNTKHPPELNCNYKKWLKKEKKNNLDFFVEQEAHSCTLFFLLFYNSTFFFSPFFSLSLENQRPAPRTCRTKLPLPITHCFNESFESHRFFTKQFLPNFTITDDRKFFIFPAESLQENGIAV